MKRILFLFLLSWLVLSCSRKVHVTVLLTDEKGNSMEPLEIENTAGKLMPDFSVPFKEGYHLSNFTIEGNGKKISDLKYNAKSGKISLFFMPDEDCTIYPNWENKKISFSYNANGGVIKDSNISEFVYGDKDFILNPAQKSGYIFKGWKYKDDFFIEKVNSSLFPIDNELDYSVHLEAVYEKDPFSKPDCLALKNIADKYYDSNNFIKAMFYYYQILVADDDYKSKKEAFVRFSEIFETFNKGMPGKGEYSKFELHDKWLENGKAYEELFCNVSPFALNIGDLFEDELNYENRTTTYAVSVGVEESDIMKLFSHASGIISSNYDGKDWPLVSISGKTDKVSVIEIFDANNRKQSVCWNACNDVDKYNFYFALVDKDNKVVAKSEKYYSDSIYRNYKLLFPGLSDSVVKQINKKELKVKLIDAKIISGSVYLNYDGYMRGNNYDSEKELEELNLIYSYYNDNDVRRKRFVKVISMYSNKDFSHYIRYY